MATTFNERSWAYAKEKSARSSLRNHFFCRFEFSFWSLLIWCI